MTTWIIFKELPGNTLPRPRIFVSRHTDRKEAVRKAANLNSENRHTGAKYFVMIDVAE